ncbi:hypothetical protein QTN25_000983 [Entamoeba marina]
MNYIKSLPTSFNTMKELKHITLAGNVLTNFPTVLTTLSALTYLNCNDNQIPFIPDSISSLQNLHKLYLNNNKLNIFPTSVFHITSLNQLQLTNNQIPLIPDIPQTINSPLTELNLMNNHIYHITDHITALKCLQSLNISDNFLSSFPSLETLEHLTNLQISNNTLTTVFSLPPNLQLLYLPYNEIHDISVALPTKLTVLLLDNNKIIQLPTSLSNLNNLRILNVASNCLNAIPSTIQFLSELQEFNTTGNEILYFPCFNQPTNRFIDLNLSFNHFILLPPTITLHQTLTSLDISHNSLMELPTDFTLLSNLRSLNMSTNNMITIPTVICKFPKLNSIVMSNNKFTLLPQQITELTTLTNIDMSVNNIIDVTPLCSLTSLRTLELSHNNITEIPLQFTQLKELMFLNLSFNYIREILREIVTPTLLLNITYNLINNIPLCFKEKEHPLLLLEGNGNSVINSNTKCVETHGLCIRSCTTTTSEMTGKRPIYEDSYTIIPCFMGFKTRFFVGLYDGHSGRMCANIVAQHLHKIITSHITAGSVMQEVLKDSYNEMQQILEKTDVEDGCTAITVILIENKIYVAWLGDTRAVLCRGGKAIQLSEDHKPTTSPEKERIVDMGGHVFSGRVNGELAVSRAFGDKSQKPIVSAIPDVREFDVSQEDEFIVIACDGVWDVVGNQTAVDIVKKSKTMEVGCVSLRDYAYSLGSQDNITAIVVSIPYCLS